MPFTPRNDPDYFTNLRVRIRGNEGAVYEIYQPNDHVPTIGYGYTFIRFNGSTWGLYERLDGDLAAIGRTLTTQQRDMLRSIVNARNAGNNGEADTLIAQLSTNFGSLNPNEPDVLFQREANQQGQYLRARMRNVLGTAAGDALSDAGACAMKRRNCLSLLLRWFALVASCLTSAVFAASPDPGSPRYQVTKGKGYSMCEAYARTRVVSPANDPLILCEPKPDAEFRLPTWDVLAVEDNLPLLHQATLLLPPYDQEDAARPSFDSWRKEFLAKIRQHELTPRLRRTRLALNERGVETLILYEPDVTACAKHQVAAGGSVFVLRDDSRLEVIVGLSILSTNVLRYHGKAVFSFLASEGDAGWMTGLYTVYPKQPGVDHYVLRDLCELRIKK